MRTDPSTGLNAFADAIISNSDTKRPEKIGLLAEIFASHGRDDSVNAHRLSGAQHEQIRLVIEGWTYALLSSEESTRSQFAKVAQAIERLPDPKFVSALRCLLAEDLVRWKRSREEFLAAHSAVRRIDSDSSMSWTLQYQRAFSAIGGTEVEKLMQEYLPDAGFCGFGITAAWVLKDLWDREQNSPRYNNLLTRSDFVDVNAQRSRHQKGEIESSPGTDAILSVVSELLKPDTREEDHRHAIALASVALLMPYSGKKALIDALLQLPGSLASKQELLKVLVVTGEIISADMIVAGINELLEEAKTKRWLLDENSGRLVGWLELLPFSDRPRALLDVISTLDPRFKEPWRLRRILSALGYAPSHQAEQILGDLAQLDVRFLAEHEWFEALNNRKTLAAGRILLGLICNGKLATHGRHDTRSLSNGLAHNIQSHSALRKEVYELYRSLPLGPSQEIVADAISGNPDIEGIMLLIREYGAQKKSFRQTDLYRALRHLLTGERSSSDFHGMQEVFSIPSPALRKELFSLIPEGGGFAELAIDCLNAIDEIREFYGEINSEPRHPDISAGRPWPCITDWRKG